VKWLLSYCPSFKLEFLFEDNDNVTFLHILVRFLIESIKSKNTKAWYSRQDQAGELDNKKSQKYYDFDAESYILISKMDKTTFHSGIANELEKKIYVSSSDISVPGH